MSFTRLEPYDIVVHSSSSKCPKYCIKHVGLITPPSREMCLEARCKQAGSVLREVPVSTGHGKSCTEPSRDVNEHHRCLSVLSYTQACLGAAPRYSISNPVALERIGEGRLATMVTRSRTHQCIPAASHHKENAAMAF